MEHCHDLLCRVDLVRSQRGWGVEERKAINPNALGKERGEGMKVQCSDGWWVRIESEEFESLWCYPLILHIERSYERF